jgi:hypothetical protein
MQDKVARLRELMRQAVPVAHEPSPEVRAANTFALYTFNQGCHPVLDTAPRARLEREIARIASWYGWGCEVARALDAHAAASVAGLTDEQAEQLAARLRNLECCVQEGLDPPDSPPAR